MPAAAEDAGAEASPAAVTTEAGVTGASASVNGDEEKRRESGKPCGTNADTTVDMNADSRGSATGGIGEDAGQSNQAKGGDHSSGRNSGEGNQAQVGGHRSQYGCADGAGTVTCASGDLAMRGEGVGFEPESSKRGSPALAGEQRIDTGAAVRGGSSKSSLSGTSCRSEINMTDKRPGEDDEAFMVRNVQNCRVSGCVPQGYGVAPSPSMGCCTNRDKTLRTALYFTVRSAKMIGAGQVAVGVDCNMPSK